jgi:hypothetical protein
MITKTKLGPKYYMILVQPAAKIARIDTVVTMMMMVSYCLSKRTPLLNTHTFTPVESELNTLSAALAATKPRLAGTGDEGHFRTHDIYA